MGDRAGDQLDCKYPDDGDCRVGRRLLDLRAYPDRGSFEVGFSFGADETVFDCVSLAPRVAGECPGAVRVDVPHAADDRPLADDAQFAPWME